MENQLTNTEPGQATPLVDETHVADCLKCDNARATYRLWEAMERGHIVEHWSIECPDCGFVDDDAKPAGRPQ